MNLGELGGDHGAKPKKRPALTNIDSNRVGKSNKRNDKKNNPSKKAGDKEVHGGVLPKLRVVTETCVLFVDDRKHHSSLCN